MINRGLFNFLVANCISKAPWQSAGRVWETSCHFVITWFFKKKCTCHNTKIGIFHKAIIFSGGSRISPRRGRQLPRGGANIRFRQIFPKTAWNWKNFNPRKGGGVPRAPLRSATDIVNVVILFFREFEDQYPWIGFNDKNDNETFVWIDNREIESVGYTNWEEGIIFTSFVSS